LRLFTASIPPNKQELPGEDATQEAVSLV